jgi:3-methylcrotonyl-CoA carboxylase alpha subunit
MALYRPFTSLLIANRGEIACRILRTARRMGLRTIAVYSEADARARHVRMADEARLIGPPPARESYLNIERILAATQDCGAEAIHPGYGFLSENPAFAEACEAAGIVFVGPPASAIRAMGSKSAAKALMDKAGIQAVPGYHGEAQDIETFVREAKRLGFPVLLKAAAGGGGKGMRIVHAARELEAAVMGAKREAESAFGDGRLIVEKFIERPRHIEVQVFGDSHGSTVSLFERECTLQRRHQKVIEEAPSAVLSDAQREALYEAARKAASAIGYVSAGTVEFVAGGGKAYFIEMNTRLQVEHPVTEMITGLDLVEWQLRVAMGERLPLRQEEIARCGHAIEARLYAEDPAAGFLPSTGEISHSRMPCETADLRIDTGFSRGDKVSHYYDPMLAKAIASGATREAALARLKNALEHIEIAGVATNAAFLARLLGDEAVRQNQVDTGYIERAEAGHPAGLAAPTAVDLAAACAALLHKEAACARRDAADPHSPWSLTNAWSLSGSRKRHIEFHTKTGRIHAAILQQGRDGMTLDTGEGQRSFSFSLADEGRFAVTLGSITKTMTTLAAEDGITVFDGPVPIKLTVIDPYAADPISAGREAGPVAPMPGTILALLAKPGETLDAGTPMLILEAMKMEHTLRFPARGQVVCYLCAVGDFVAEGAALAKFEAEEAE